MRIKLPKVWIVRCSCGSVDRLERDTPPQSCQSPKYFAFRRTVTCGRALASVEEIPAEQSL